MAANSNHYGDVLSWLNKVLDSCQTKEQVDNTRKLFLRFENIYNPLKKHEFINDSICDLYRKAIIKRGELFEAEFKSKINKQ